MLRELRLLVRHRGVVRRVCKIAFSGKDASMYLFPYGIAGRYFYGSQKMPEEQVSHTFNFKEQFRGDRIPKLSIHETGQVHVYIEGQKKAGPLLTIPISQMRGEQIASVSIDRFEKLAEHKDTLKQTGPEQDVVIDVDPEAESGRFVIFGRANGAVFDRTCALVVSMQRPPLKETVHFCFKPVRQDPLGPETKGGVTVLAGWDPRQRYLQEEDFLYVRAE